MRADAFPERGLAALLEHDVRLGDQWLNHALGGVGAVLAGPATRRQQRRGRGQLSGQVEVAAQIDERVGCQLHASHTGVGLGLPDKDAVGDHVDVASAYTARLVDPQPGGPQKPHQIRVNGTGWAACS